MSKMTARQYLELKFHPMDEQSPQNSPRRLTDRVSIQNQTAERHGKRMKYNQNAKHNNSKSHTVANRPFHFQLLEGHSIISLCRNKSL
jgi:hypothetical protein